MDLMPEEVFAGVKLPRPRTVPSEPVAGSRPKFVSERDGAHVIGNCHDRALDPQLQMPVFPGADNLAARICDHAFQKARPPGLTPDTSFPSRGSRVSVPSRSHTINT